MPRVGFRRRYRSSEDLAAKNDAFLGPVPLHRPESAHRQPCSAKRPLSAEQFLPIVAIPREPSAQVSSSSNDALSLSHQVKAWPLTLHRRQNLPLVHVPLPATSRQLLVQKLVGVLQRLKKLFLTSAHNVFCHVIRKGPKPQITCVSRRCNSVQQR